MKKLFAIAIMALTCIQISAQEAGQMRFGATAGMNISTANLEASHSSKIGFHAGIKGEYNFTENVFLNAGLQYSMRGVKDVTEYKLKWNPGYIELPIHVGYRYAFNETVKAFVEAGPYFGIAVSGKMSGDGGSVDLFSDEATSILGGKYKRFEMGIGGAVGVEFSGVQLRVGYDYALTKLCDLSNSGRNSNLYVGLAYMF